MSDTSNENVGFDLDTEVEGTNTTSDEFEVDEFEALDQSSDDVEGEPAEGVSDESDEAPRPGRRRRDEENVDPSEFQYDATPRPRLSSGEGAKKEPGQKRNFQPIPDGWTTPTGLRHILFDRRVANTSSQAMYGFVKNGKDFPYKQHSDGRFIVPVEDETARAAGSELANGPSEIGGVSWCIQAFARRAERRAKAEADAQKAAEQAEASTVDNTGVDHADDVEGDVLVED
jgi:hypothetical protein